MDENCVEPTQDLIDHAPATPTDGELFEAEGKERFAVTPIEFGFFTAAIGWVLMAILHTVKL